MVDQISKARSRLRVIRIALDFELIDDALKLAQSSPHPSLMEDVRRQQRMEKELSDARAANRQARRLISSTHRRAVTHKNCEVENCSICVGGLFVCADCGAVEIETEERVCTHAEKAEPSGVRVKKLEWKEESPFIWSAEQYSIAHYPGALVLQFELKFEGRLLGIGWHRTKDEAKAAAQAVASACPTLPTHPGAHVMTNKPEGVGEAREWRGREIPIECPYPALGAIGAPSGYDIDPGAASATDRFQREWPSRCQVGDLHNRDGRVVPLYSASTVTALQEQIAGLVKERDEAADRIEELEREAGDVSSEFEGECWKAMRSLLDKCEYPWDGSGDRVTADDAREFIAETLNSQRQDADRLRARAEKAEASGVRVKKLEWKQLTDDAWWAKTELGVYRIYWYGGHDWTAFLESGHGSARAVSSLDAAKAAAQADYERRILSALEPYPSAGVNAELLDRALAVIDAMISNDPNEPISDAGHTALDGWKYEVEQIRIARASAEPTPAVTDAEPLRAAVRAAKLALFAINKAGAMPNDSWRAGFDRDLAIAEAALSLPQTREATQGDETAWLAEHKTTPVEYACLTSDYDEHFTTDPAKALRFARRQDAQAFIDYHGWTRVEAVEHMWTDGRAMQCPDPDDETYEIGKRDGYESAIQDLDLATGGDGEFRGSTVPGLTVDVPAMKARIIERFASSSPAAPAAMWKPTHRHVKRGSDYMLIGFGKMQSTWWVDSRSLTGAQPVDMREVAIYREHDGSWWVRPREEFEDGRFEVLPPAPAAETGVADKRELIIKGLLHAASNRSDRLQQTAAIDAAVAFLRLTPSFDSITDEASK